MWWDEINTASFDVGGWFIASRSIIGSAACDCREPGHGRRATLFTDYTLAVWQGSEFVPVAKAYSGLTDDEIDSVDAFVRANTTGRFGPVRAVRPELVFELAFEGIARSTRHKAGLGLRFPRIARWRHDKKPADADSVETLRRLAEAAGTA